MLLLRLASVGAGGSGCCFGQRERRRKRRLLLRPVWGWVVVVVVADAAAAAVLVGGGGGGCFGSQQVNHSRVKLAIRTKFAFTIGRFYPPKRPLLVVFNIK